MCDAKHLLVKWCKRARTNQKAHYAEEERLRVLYYWLGIPAIIAAVSASAISVPLYKQIGEIAIFILSSISFIAALLTALIAFFRIAERASQHHSAALRYSRLHRQIESAIAQDLPEGEELMRLLNTIERDLNSASDISPFIPFKRWSKVPEHLTPEPTSPASEKLQVCQHGK